MGKITFAVLTIGIFNLAGCGDSLPEGNGTADIQILSNTEDSRMPLVDGTKLQFSHMAIASNSNSLSFIFSIDPSGVQSQNGNSFVGSLIVLRVSQSSSTKDYALQIIADVEGRMGVNFSTPQSQIYENFDRSQPADFKILYSEVEILHGSFRF